MTEEKLLNLALHGGEKEWDELQKLCRDRDIAKKLGAALERHTTDTDDVAAAWAGVLEDLHPGLKVKLPPSDRPSAAPSETRPRVRLRILCAEDHEQICEILKKVLSEAGHVVECFFDGRAAWERISADLAAFDVVLTDYQMPLMDGLELVRRLRSAAYVGRIIIHSGNLTPEIEKAFHMLNVDRIVRKTVRPEYIIELIAGFE